MGLIRNVAKICAIVIGSLLALLFISSPVNERMNFSYRTSEYQIGQSNDTIRTILLKKQYASPEAVTTRTITVALPDNESSTPGLSNRISASHDTTRVSGTKCPRNPPGLIGNLSMEALGMENTISEKDVIRKYPDIQPGGRWAPTDCKALDKVAIIIPFRDRQSHLDAWLFHTIAILKRQLLDFRIVVVEQEGTGYFNKGRLFNAAFEFISTLDNITCCVFHDVDLFLENDRSIYFCTARHLRHIGAYVDKLGYSVMYNHMVGGVVALTVKDYISFNGYSNLFWGWGGEDDDLGLRMYGTNMTISRPSKAIARYKMMKHPGRYAAEAYAKRWDILRSSQKRWKVDGYSKRMWRIQQVQVKPLYYKLVVAVGEADVPDRRPKKQNITISSQKRVTTQGKQTSG